MKRKGGNNRGIQKNLAVVAVSRATWNLNSITAFLRAKLHDDKYAHSKRSRD